MEMIASLVKRLVIFEMANNHMGDVQHGLRIIREFSEVAKIFRNRFTFAIKFQYRDLDTFIHPDYQGRMDHKYVKRFSETRLIEEQFLMLKREAEACGFMTICTPFDEASVDKIVSHGYDILKIASASCGDWPLLEKIAMTNLPIIFSTGGATLEQVDRVVSFFQHRSKQFAVMHCVGEYPTAIHCLQLNQIELLRQRYPGVPIGYSTHEEPGNIDAVKIAIAKGAQILEKHVGVPTDQYDLNAYSATPVQVTEWLNAAYDACEMCGIADERHPFSEKELSDIRQFQRGAFALRDIAEGERVDQGNTFYAFPNEPEQVVANQLSKYTVFTALGPIRKGEPIINVSKTDTRSKVIEIVTHARGLLAQAGIAVTNQLNFEISHHYGIERFYEYGAVIITCVNRQYAKKLILVFPGQQRHPVHYHEVKEETFHVLYGDVTFTLDDKLVETKAGDIITVERGVRHDFSSQNGAIFEEISSTHIVGDSYYDDPAIGQNQFRKTVLDYWID